MNVPRPVVIFVAVIGVVFLSLLYTCSRTPDGQRDTSTNTSDSDTSDSEATDQPTPMHPQNARQLLVTGEKLYAEAANIVDNTPTTETRAAELVGTGGGRDWYDADRDFQSAIGELPHNPGRAMLPGADLIEAETFMYSAVESALAACNQHDAELNLKVARAYLNEVHNDLNNAGSSDWQPPDITGDADNSSDCQGQ